MNTFLFTQITNTILGVLGNVLVIGNSGVGKSTLINAVLGEDAEKKAVTGRGIKGTTTELEIYENNGISFSKMHYEAFDN